MNKSTYAMTTDTALYLLSDETRRAVVYSLATSEGHQSIETLLSDSEAETGHGSSSDEYPLTREQRITLYHIHLPTLEDHDVIAWNRDQATVAKGNAFHEIRPVSDLLRGNETKLPTEFGHGEQ